MSDIVNAVTMHASDTGIHSQPTSSSAPIPPRSPTPSPIEVTCPRCARRQSPRPYCISCGKILPKVIVVEVEVEREKEVLEVVEVDRVIVEERAVEVVKEVVVARLCPLCKETKKLRSPILPSPNPFIASTPTTISADAPDVPPGEETEKPAVPTLAETERLAIIRALAVAKGDRKLAAKWLGIGKTSLYRKVKLMELEGFVRDIRYQEL